MHSESVAEGIAFMSFFVIKSNLEDTHGCCENVNKNDVTFVWQLSMTSRVSEIAHINSGTAGSKPLHDI